MYANWSTEALRRHLATVQASLARGVYRRPEDRRRMEERRDALTLALELRDVRP